MKRYVKGIANLTGHRLNKIKAAVKKLKCHDQDEDEINSLSRDFYLPKFVKAMQDMGFKYVTTTSGTGIFLNKELKIVVKAPLICGWTIPLRAVPTVIIKDDMWTIFVQPLVDTSRKAVSKAMKVKRRIENYDLDHFGDDAHNGNVGMYRNKAVIFDW